MSSVRRQVRYVQVHDNCICHRFLPVPCGHDWQPDQHLTSANDRRYVRPGSCGSAWTLFYKIHSTFLSVYK